MKTKQQLDPNAAGLVAARLIIEDDKANATLKDMRTNKATRKEHLKAALTVVWSALESGAMVNGYSTKEEWCKEFAKVTIKTVQRIIFGREESEATKRSLVIKPGMLLVINGVKYRVPELEEPRDNYIESSHKDYLKSRDPNTYASTVTLIGLEIVEDKKEEQPAPGKKTPKKKEKKEHLRHIKDGIGAVSLCGVWYKHLATPKHPANCKKCIKLQAQPETPHGVELRVPTGKIVDPQKDLSKRWRAAKRMAKFYCGMMKELTDGVDDNYDKLLNLYTDRRYPWTPPVKDYCLPKTEKEFQAEYDKAIADFDAVVAEDEAAAKLQHPAAKALAVAMGEITTCPEEEAL